MKCWIEQLDGFIKLAKKDIFNNKGRIDHDDAMKKAHMEYDKYKKNSK